MNIYSIREREHWMDETWYCIRRLEDEAARVPRRKDVGRGIRYAKCVLEMRREDFGHQGATAKNRRGKKRPRHNAATGKKRFSPTPRQRSIHSRFQFHLRLGFSKK